MKLISMVDYVLEQEVKLYEDETGFLNDRLVNIFRYANFLKQPLELGMFIPCDEDGNVLEEPEKLIKALEKVNQEYYDLKSNHYKDNERYKWAVETITSDKKYQEYQEAKERVLFKDVSESRIAIVKNLTQGTNPFDIEYFVEDLFTIFKGDSPTLTESAINKLN
ncbi:hypothetical protein [uncultured Lutibacter sp.]|uniref:hypothetical protein n=1 Tax=uncultured Lutibacter sp. TaxID=437739 RepID=UPI002620B954|nr:hypothetical protein [uncultured Lutibacter sp.]